MNIMISSNVFLYIGGALTKYDISFYLIDDFSFYILGKVESLILLFK